MVNEIKTHEMCGVREHKDEDERMVIATSFLSRVRGLNALSKDFKGELMLVSCRDIHTYTMSDPIDVAFIDRSGVVIASYKDVPIRSRYKVQKACCVIERYATRDVDWYEVGDSIFMTHGKEVPHEDVSCM